jgi:hypothetical protein
MSVFWGILLYFEILKFIWAKNAEDSIEQFCGDGRRLSVYVLCDTFVPFATEHKIFMLEVIPLH